MLVIPSQSTKLKDYIKEHDYILDIFDTIGPRYIMIEWYLSDPSSIDYLKDLVDHYTDKYRKTLNAKHRIVANHLSILIENHHTMPPEVVREYFLTVLNIIPKKFKFQYIPDDSGYLPVSLA